MWFTCCTHSFKMLISCRIKTTLYEFTYEKPFKYILNKNFKWNHAVKHAKLNLLSFIFAKMLKLKKGVERNNENILRVVWKAIKTYPSTRMKFLMCVFSFNFSWNIIETCSHISLYNNSCAHDHNLKLLN